MKETDKTIVGIVASDIALGIGYNGELLCHLPDDLKRFKEITMGHSIIMGRKTFESLPNGALPGRENIVITRNRDYHADGVKVVHSLNEAIDAATMPGEVFIIGGAILYYTAFDLMDKVYMTVIDHKFDKVDARFPELLVGDWVRTFGDEHKADERHPYDFWYVTFTRRERQQ